MPPCFDANGGVFEPLLDRARMRSSPTALNHASIIDGVRLCKAKRYRYANADMDELERCLQEAQAQRFRIIVTDGVFSMDGNVAPMDRICDLAEKYDALVMVDECHSAGVVGATGHGVSELFDTLWTCRYLSPARWARRSAVRSADSRPVARRSSTCCASVRVRTCSPTLLLLAVVGAGIEVFKMLKESNALHDKLMDNVERTSASKMLAAGFDIKPTQSGYLRRNAVRCQAVAGLMQPACRTKVFT